MYPYFSLATNNFIFISFGHFCASSAQTHKFCNISSWFLCSDICKEVCPSSSWAIKSSSGFSSASLAQLHYVPKVSKVLLPAARFHSEYSHLSLASNNLFFNSTSFSCASLARAHIFSSTATLPSAATCKAISPYSNCASNKLYFDFKLSPCPKCGGVYIGQTAIHPTPSQRAQ